MQRYTSKPESVIYVRWDGTADSDLIAKLNKAGWSTHVQLPIDGQTVNFHNEAEGKWEKVAAPARLIIVGPYRGQFTFVEADQYLIWNEQHGDSFAYTSRAPRDGEWNLDSEGDAPKIPTPDDFKAHTDLDGGW